MKFVYPILGPSIIVGLWFLLTLAGTFSPLLLPPPGEVFSRFFGLFGSGEILPDLGATVYRWLLGFGVGVAIGIPIGLLMGYFVPVRLSLAFVVDAARSLPVISLIPLFLIFFGIGDAAKIAIAAWAAALSVIINAMYGASRTKEGWLLAAKSLGAKPIQIFAKVVVPGSLPDIFVGIRLAVSHALVVVVAAEMMFGGESGVGRKLADAAMLYRTPDVYALIAITGIIGYCSNFGFLYFERRFVPWAIK